MQAIGWKYVRVIALSLAAIQLTGCNTMPDRTAMSGGLALLEAASITDAQMMQKAQAAAQALDQENTLASANSAYQKRVNKLAKNLKSVNGVPLDIKVYMKNEINAFAMADGTIRIYSKLMDSMNDDELLFIIGHEMGHVAKGHTAQRMRAALLTQAGRKIVQSTAGGTIAALTASQLGDLVEKVINAQFSQANEREADDFGLLTLKQNGGNPVGAATALEKLATMSGQGSNFVTQMVATHPEPSARAARIRKAL
ncbi:putative metalloprotease [Allochromatium warmingii]|uniref:Putative metalloprotease n=2 Tax=Allochromatium warmingii TaxID=61595 RepID=A0A1H3E9N0_ALLWA|nr:putative metalloprotease [Allochromatium warmingii]